MRHVAARTQFARTESAQSLVMGPALGLPLPHTAPGALPVSSNLGGKAMEGARAGG